MFYVKRILIIDDEPLIRRLFKDWFGRYEFIVDETGGPATALDLILLNQYTIIIVDFSMPDMDGSELTKEIRKISPEAIIIGMSAQWWVEDLFYQAGANHFLQKPIDFNILESIVNQSPKSI